MTLLTQAIAKAWRPLHRLDGFLRGRLNHHLAQTKCVLGKNSVVYDHSLLNNLGNDISSIRVGESSHIRGELLTYPGGHIEIGDYCYLGVNSHVWSDTSVKIGNRVLIAHDVSIFDNQTHPIDALERHKQFAHIIQHGHPKNYNLNGAEVVIEDDAWIACNSVILHGVTIGKSAIIGAGSVVTKSIPAYAIACGNPAKIVRMQQAKP